MTIDDQLRTIARRTDELQHPITAEEIVQRPVVSYMPVQPTEEKATMIDLEASSHNDEQRKGAKRFVVAALLAAAVVVAIALVAIRRDDSTSPADQPTPTARVAPITAAPTTVAPTPGTYVMSEFHPLLETESDVRLTFAVPAGWAAEDMYVLKSADPSIGVVFDKVANVYTDSCPSVTVSPSVGPTVSDLASAWANLPGFDATAPIDITVDGFHGKQVEFTVPDYDEAECAYGAFKLLEAVGGGAWWAQGPNQHNQLWILDVNGTRLVIIAATFPDTSSEDRAAIDEILASIQIG